MTTPELLEFIRIEHALGMSLDEITRLLVSEGEWDTADVAEAFRALGLPEEAVERFVARVSGAAVAPVAPVVVTAPLEQVVAPLPPEEKAVAEAKPTPPPVAEPVQRHAPAPVSAPGPKDMEYPRHAAPMHYVEQPEVKPIPTLARPASLSGQTSRPLVRTVSTAATYAKVQKLRPGEQPHSAQAVHVSKLQTPETSVRAAAGPAKLSGGVLPKPKEIEGTMQQIQDAITFGAEIPREEPKPKSVAAAHKNILPENEQSLVPPLHIGLGGEVHDGHAEAEKEVTAPAPKPVVVEPVSVPSVAEKPAEKFEFHMPEATKPLAASMQPQPEAPAPKAPEVVPPAPTPAPAPVVTPPPPAPAPIVAPEPVPAPAPIVAPAPVVPPPAPAPVPAPLPPTPPAPVPAPAPAPVAAPVPPPAPAPAQPQQMYAPMPPQPQIIFAAPPQYMQMPPQMYAVPMTAQPQSMGVGMAQPHVAEIGSTAPDVEEQAYLAQFGQAPMPAGLLRQQPAPVSMPTIIYAPQVMAPTPAPAPIVMESPKKPEPMRFDVGRMRAAHKTEQTSNNGRPSIVSAVSGMQPVESKTIEDVFKSQSSIRRAVELPTVERGDVVRSLKVPHKRTMTADLVRVQEGVLPEQVVAQSTKTEAISGVAMPNTAAAMIDDEPVPPPPPKKPNKPILLITLSVLFLLVAGGLAAYYFIVWRLPGAQEVYDNALAVALRGPVLTYDATLQVHATSTDAEPEYINANIVASGTVAVSTKAFDDGVHSLKLSVNHTGVSLPINLDFDGDLQVLKDDVFVAQRTPTQGAPIENLLREGEWVQVPYQGLGVIMGLSAATSTASGEYGSLTPATSLFSLFIRNSPVRVVGTIEKYLDSGREYYRIPLTVDAKRMVLDGDLLGKYIRGIESPATTASRSAILEERYRNIRGELIVDKLLMRPIKLSFDAKFDPSKISLNGDMQFVLSFRFGQPAPVIDVKAKTLDAIRLQRQEESASEEVITRDAPVRMLVPTVALAIKQYAEKEGRYPMVLNDLVTAGFIGQDALSTQVISRLSYSAYVDRPAAGTRGTACVPKKGKCGFFHFGATLEYLKSQELANDADFESFTISGGDETGCKKEPGRACLDITGEITSP